MGRSEVHVETMNKTLLLFLRKILQSNFQTLSLPYKLTIAITYKCNQQCIYCNIWNKPERQELLIEDFDRFFSSSNEFSWIHLTGGEIFLREDLLEIIRIIFKRSKELYLLQFPTNGFLTENIISSIEEILTMSNKKAPRILVGVSIDGTQEIHDKFRNTKNAWNNAVNTFIELRKMKPLRVYIGMTLSPLNYHLVDKMYLSIKDKCPDFSYDDLNINILNKSQHYYDNVDNSRTRFSQKDIGSVIDVINRILATRGVPIKPSQYLSRKYLRYIEKNLKSEPIPFKCQALSASCFIDPYGNIFPCALWSKEIGNIREIDFSLKNKWNCEHVRNLRKRICKNECPTCWTPCEAYPSMLGGIGHFMVDRNRQK